MNPELTTKIIDPLWYSREGEEPGDKPMNPNTAKITDPIWDSRNSDEPGDPPTPTVRKESIDWKARAEKAENLVHAHIRTQQCAKCGEVKPTPYRRDDLGGYVCLTCVERYLDATLDAAENLRAELDRERMAAAQYRHDISQMWFLCAGESQPVEDYAIRALAVSDSGKDYHHRDEYKGLVVALESARVEMLDMMGYTHAGGREALLRMDGTIGDSPLQRRITDIKRIEKALSDARAKGLIE